MLTDFIAQHDMHDEFDNDMESDSASGSSQEDKRDRPIGQASKGNRSYLRLLPNTCGHSEVALELLLLDAEDMGNHPFNPELYGCHALIHALLYHSFLELSRKSSQHIEANFWRSRRADYFVSMLNELRGLMNKPEVACDELRRGIAAKLGYHSEWLIPIDGKNEFEVDRCCARYKAMWADIYEANPNGVDDPTSDRLFVQTPKAKPKAKPSVESKSLEVTNPQTVRNPSPLEHPLQADSASQGHSRRSGNMRAFPRHLYHDALIH
ncbi:hypothetical protein VRRI112168_03405 [Vreelandella rituensis]|uniref:Uncharacterized protein n=1 Tax=Vreelandella rituensis TaxID=2282306 RepID=A0A368U9C0_9GAMM|nr:hypothetical protein [Halomonas rituensis]RCV93700.1 hypothetical protein DU506_00675 [Halomonas rituensis]